VRPAVWREQHLKAESTPKIARTGPELGDDIGRADIYREAVEDPCQPIDEPCLYR